MTEVFYHGTSLRALAEIEKLGRIKPVSYWGSYEVAAYYAEVTAEEQDDRAVILQYPIAKFLDQYLEPDYPGIEEPITYTIGKKESAVWREWKQSDKTWQDSWQIIQSVRYTADVMDDGDLNYELHEGLKWW